MASSSSSATSPIPVVQVEHQQQQDRFGALPEDILMHIVSFLPTLDAVRTSVLSTCWRNLWTSVSAIDLDEQYDREFFSRIRTITGAKRKRNRNRSNRRFVELVDKVLSFHQTPTLHKLWLFCSSVNCPLYRWVYTAVSRRVQTLDLRLPWAAARPLPSLLFASESLVDLRLDHNGSALILPGTIALVGLRRMRLCRVKFWDNQSTCALFSSSTALRSLALENCDYEKLGCLDISCSSLQELAIENDLLEVGGYLGNCQVKIATPHLSSFVYRVSVAQAYVVEPLLCLEYVKIEFRSWLDKHSILDRASSFLCSLSSAKNLDICPACVEVLLRYKGGPFNNLNVLRTAVERLDYGTLCVVLRLLLLNPQLRAVIVEVRRLYVLSSSAGKEDFLELLGACFESGINGVLGRVEIRCSTDHFTFASYRKAVRYTTDAVLELVRVLLESQARLKKLILSNRLFCDSSSPDHRLDTVMEKVLSFPKRSTELLAVAFI